MAIAVLGVRDLRRETRCLQSVVCLEMAPAKWQEGALIFSTTLADF